MANSVLSSPERLSERGAPSVFLKRANCDTPFKVEQRDCPIGPADDKQRLRRADADTVDFPARNRHFRPAVGLHRADGVNRNSILVSFGDSSCVDIQRPGRTGRAAIDKPITRDRSKRPKC